MKAKLRHSGRSLKFSIHGHSTGGKGRDPHPRVAPPGGTGAQASGWGYYPTYAQSDFYGFFSCRSLECLGFRDAARLSRQEASRIHRYILYCPSHIL
jgi:hypothetical protein